MTKEKILIVDDEPHILELVRYNLEASGFKVIEAMDGKTAIELTESQRPDLILLDLMLPGVDGLEVCRILRRQSSTRDIPIIMLTAKGEEIDKVLGLEIGADDYITKPFSPRELTARIKAVLRRSSPEKKENVIKAGGLTIDVEKYEVTVEGEKQEFTPKEFELLKLLASNPGKVFSREYLLENIWGYDYLGDTRTVDVHIRHLRQKIEKDSDRPVYIETVRGIGYKFNEPE
ncbi:response regulator [Thermoanaerobacterium sp. DL9XJH110]|uniref:response regulator n=1 Tax=Thermoanaerobacterium sp. DL9XJH110 TaxID=3386643 RepID=UPI003BB77C37